VGRWVGERGGSRNPSVSTRRAEAACVVSVNGCYIDIARLGSQQKAQWAQIHEAFKSKEKPVNAINRYHVVFAFEVRIGGQQGTLRAPVLQSASQGPSPYDRQLRLLCFGLEGVHA
jgi:hypothetical protein